ncbi:MAG: polymer-forming cytoskeletal protein [Clostridia bacterium]|nr:polymer-forming cytoskeletal protein [Clostridia bacterium]
MFKKKQGENEELEKMNTLIGEGTSCEGRINSAGSLRIDGDFKGEIRIAGDLIVGEKAMVEASIEARNVYIGGYIRGNIQTEGKVDLTPTGAFFGDMLVGILNIEEGAVFKGNCEMHEPKREEEQQDIQSEPVVEQAS